MSTPFINLVGSYQQVAAEGGVGRDPSWPSLPWLPLSWKQPFDFRTALCAEAESVFGAPSKSRLGSGIDWYADAVTRYLSRSTRSPMVRSYDQTAGWQTLNLGALDAQAGALATLLAARGAEPGDRIALVLPSGTPLAIGLLATMRLGGCAVPILPMGSTYVQTLLAASKPKWVISCSPYHALRGLMAFKPLLLSAALLASAGEPPPSATYAPEAPLLLVASPLRADGTLTTVSAADAYGGALRDGLLILGLRPGETLLAPPTAAHLPMTLLTTLLCGACLVELSQEAIDADAAALIRSPASAALLTTPVRDALTAAQVGPARWGRWFRDPQEPLDPAAWEQAEQWLRLSDIPHANLVWDAAAGGAVLASQFRRGRLHPYVAPAPGCRHLLAESHGKGPALTAVGRLVLLGADEKPTGSPGEALLARTNRGFLYAGSAVPRRSGWAYPTASTLAVLAEARESQGIVEASVVAVPGGGPLGQALFVLVLFTGAAPTERCNAQACLDLLERELGSAAHPDRVEIFALYPRRLAGDPWGAIDPEWVTEQYLSGELHRKRRTSLYGKVTRVRAAVLAFYGLGST